MNFKEWLEAFRIDPEKISDFSNTMNTYVSNPEGTSSGRVEDGTTKDKFPNELNDTFFALAVVTGASSSQLSSSPIGSASLSSIEKESSIRLGEANLYRIVN